MSELADILIAYFVIFREHHPGVDMVFAGGEDYPYYCEAKAHADKNGWTFAHCPGNHRRNTILKYFDFEDMLINTQTPSVSHPALIAAATAVGCHVVSHCEPWTLSDDGHEQYSIVFHPGPEGWVENLFRQIAKAKLITAAPTALDHGSYRTTSITYPGVYAKEVTLLRFRCEAYSDGVGAQYLYDRLYWLNRAGFNSQWLLHYRKMADADLEFNLPYENHDYGYVTCETCTVVMGNDIITYRCNCPSANLESIDLEVEALKKKLALK